MSEARSTRGATYEDLCKVPETMVAELVEGELWTNARPSPRHANASSILGGFLIPSYGRRGGGPDAWVILDEPELHLGQDVPVPDIAAWRRERLPVLPETVGIEVPPDWVCEVVSPSTTRLDRVRKMPVYAREGGRHIWLVDPLARTLEVFALDGGRWVLLRTAGNDELVRAEPFAEVEIDLLAVWDEKRGE